MQATNPSHDSSSQMTIDTYVGLGSYFLLPPLFLQAVKLAIATSKIFI